MRISKRFRVRLVENNELDYVNIYYCYDNDELLFYDNCNNEVDINTIESISINIKHHCGVISEWVEFDYEKIKNDILKDHKIKNVQAHKDFISRMEDREDCDCSTCNCASGKCK